MKSREAVKEQSVNEVSLNEVSLNEVSLNEDGRGAEIRQMLFYFYFRLVV